SLTVLASSLAGVVDNGASMVLSSCIINNNCSPHNYLYNYGKTIRKKEALDKLALPKVCRKNSTTPRQPFFKAGIKK
ncbi:MAG: hypothetical protein ACTH3J_04880, partial [Leuconostoc mesenteroides]